MKILITGASGFIGKNLLEALVKLGGNEIAYTTHRVQGYIYNFGREFCVDLTSKNDVEFLFNHFQPDLIYHLAGKATVKSDEFEIMRSNVDSTHLLLKYAPQDCRFVLASSIIVHGNVDKVSDLDIPNSPNSIYGVSKLCAEKLVQKYHMDGKVQGRILRLVGNCGAGASHGVVKDLLEKLRSKSEFLEILGDAPGSCKPFVHVDDTVQALILAGNYNKPEQAYYYKNLLIANVGQNDEITSEQVAECIMKASGITKPIKFLGEAANWKSDNRRLSCFSDRMLYLGWKPRYNSSIEAVEAAVKDMIS